MRRNFTAPPPSWRLWQSGPGAPAICDAQDINGGGAIGMSRTGNRHECRAIEEQIRRLLAMAAGDNDDVGAERVDAPRELLAVDGGVADEHARLEQVRRGDRGARQQ